MNVYDFFWIEDDKTYVDSVLYYLKGKRQELHTAVIPWHYLSLDDLNNKKTIELSSICMSLILVDYNLPGGVNGDEVIHKIRSYPANKNIIIIFYSGVKELKELKRLTDLYINIMYSDKDSLKDEIERLLRIGL